MKESIVNNPNLPISINVSYLATKMVVGLLGFILSINHHIKPSSINIGEFENQCYRVIIWIPTKMCEKLLAKGSIATINCFKLEKTKKRVKKKKKRNSNLP